MKNIVHTIKNTDWQHITETIHQNGYAIIPDLLSEEECELLKSDYDHSSLYRKTVVMARHRFGLGEYKYFTYPLPEIIQTIRTTIYPCFILTLWYPFVPFSGFNFEIWKRWI